MSVLFAFFHHILAFTLVSTLAIEFVLIRGELNLSAAKKLQFTDTINGISAGLLIIVGILRVVYFEKGVYYYLHSHSFYAKMAAFVFVGIFRFPLIWALLGLGVVSCYITYRALKQLQTKLDDKSSSEGPKP